MFDKKQVAEQLRKEAASNPAANAVFLVLATRDRARSTLTVAGLDQKMRSEGFSFKRADYARIIKLLANLGIGKLMTDDKKRVAGIKEIKTTLQSIGKVASGQNEALENYRLRNRFEELATPVAMAPKPEAAKPPTFKASLRLFLDIDGKQLSIPVPEDFTAEQVIKLAKSLEGASST